MRIAEISTPELRPSHHHELEPHACIVAQIESSIKQLELQSSVTSSPEISLELQHALTQLTELAPFPNSVNLHIWKLSYRLWNACVDLSNVGATGGIKFSEDHAKLRQVSAHLLFLAAEVTGIPSPAFKCASFFYKTGLIWHDLRKFDLANGCFEKATDLISKIEINTLENDERKLLLDLNLARSRTAWEVSDRNLSITLLNRSKNVLFGISENYKALASQFLMFGKIILSKNEASGVNDALKLMNEALELCDKGLKMVKRTGETLTLKELRAKTLRFIAAVHLQREEFESVLKCVRILRDAGGEQHPSLSVLGMKAWLGLGRYGEAEKELRGMVINKGIPEGVWVSAVVSYFQAAGTAGAETAKGLFLGLLGRCHVSAFAAIRVVNSVLGDIGGGVGEASKVRAKVVAELASDERVVALFAGEAVAKERTAMHALLWNCAAEHFRSKDYQTSAELFEKSMLYVPYDLEKRILRAKGFRVLCLCHLGLSQLDRAQEYINEAEKLEPNIASVFLKFKIFLQQKDYSSAIAQVQAMSSCLDFTPDFLSLSAHEAVACCSISVAVASLSNLLNFYSLRKQLQTTEVVIFRTLLTILSQEEGNDYDILKYMRRAHARVTDVGSECFFGKGEVGKRERNWFAVNAWNFGVKTGREKNYNLAAQFFKLASEFYGIILDGEAEDYSVMVCKSVILSVSAIIADEKQTMDTLAENEAKQAIELLERAGKILTRIPAPTWTVDDRVTTVEPNFHFMYTWSAYDLYARQSDMGQKQLLLIKSFASSKSCNPKHLLQIGLDASQGPRSNPEVAAFALNTCLAAALSSSSPDYQEVALILRKLISVGTVFKEEKDDDVVIELYRRAYRIMVGLKEGEYPIEEAKWLSMTAWNRAAIPVRLGQTEAAKKWMSIGLELAKKVPGMQTYRSCMEDFVAEYEKKSHDYGNAENRHEKINSKCSTSSLYTSNRVALYSQLCDLKRYDSNCLEAGGHKWQLSIYPEADEWGKSDNYTSIHLVLADQAKNLPTGFEVTVSFKIFFVRPYPTIEDAKHKEERFHKIKLNMAYPHLISLAEFNESSNGYLRNDSCIFGAEVFVVGNTKKAECISYIEEPLGRIHSWSIQNFSKSDGGRHFSHVINAAGKKWKLAICPKGHEQYNVSIFLYWHNDDGIFSSILGRLFRRGGRQKFYIECALRAVDQLHQRHKEITARPCFDDACCNWASLGFLSMGTFRDESKGFLVNDTIVIEVNFNGVLVTNDT